jgi:hypothetical protein
VTKFTGLHIVTRDDTVLLRFTINDSVRTARLSAEQARSLANGLREAAALADAAGMGPVQGSA